MPRPPFLRCGGALIAAAALLASCTTEHYAGPPMAREQLAVINTGTTVVRQIDGQTRRGGAFDVSQFEVAPGPHHLALVFELPARSIGLKTLPAQAGIGMCLLDFSAEAGKQYYLGSRASGEPNDPHWNGKWEAWVRDPTLSADN